MTELLQAEVTRRAEADGRGRSLHDWTPLDTIGGEARILTVANELLVAIFFLAWICTETAHANNFYCLVFSLRFHFCNQVELTTIAFPVSIGLVLPPYSPGRVLLRFIASKRYRHCCRP